MSCQAMLKHWFCLVF